MPKSLIIRSDNTFFTQKFFKNRIDFKFFVYLRLIVRGEIRTVEGNLCLYPANEIWKILRMDIRCELASLYGIQSVFLLILTG